MDLTVAESKATYEKIKEYVKEQTGLQVSNLYFAQVKQKYSIVKREAYKEAKVRGCEAVSILTGKRKSDKESVNAFLDDLNLPSVKAGH